jgi:general stress protein 26
MARRACPVHDRCSPSIEPEFVMQIAIQPNAELAKLGAQLAHMPVAMLNHLDARGALHSRPITPVALDAQGALWCFTDLGTARAEYLRVINLCFSDPQRATYVSISARGEIQTDRAHIERLWSPQVQAWFPAGPGSDNLALLKVVPSAAEVWDAPCHRMSPVLVAPAPAEFGDWWPNGEGPQPGMPPRALNGG